MDFIDCTKMHELSSFLLIKEISFMWRGLINAVSQSNCSRCPYNSFYGPEKANPNPYCISFVLHKIKFFLDMFEEHQTIFIVHHEF